MSTQGITYEIAIALKNAGFPQKGNGTVFNFTDSPTANPLDAGLEEVYVPTLSELIEACGEQRFALENSLNTRMWHAYIWIPGEKCNHCDTCSCEKVESKFIRTDPEMFTTPIEAVANLWLKLNHHE